MRLGVTGRSRTGTSGFTAHGSAIELRPHPSARLSGLGGRSARAARSAFGPLLRNVLAGKPARANGCGLAPSALQAAAFNHLATSRCLAPDHGIEPQTFGFSSGVTSLRDMSLAGAPARGGRYSAS